MIASRPAADRLAGALQKLSRARARSATDSSHVGRYRCMLERDGSFRVEDVEAGVYDLISWSTSHPATRRVGLPAASCWDGPPRRDCPADARRPKRRAARPGLDPTATGQEDGRS